MIEQGIRNKQESNCDVLNGRWEHWGSSKLDGEDNGVCGTATHKRHVYHIFRNKRLQFRKEVRGAALASGVRFSCSLILTTWNIERFIRIYVYKETV